MNEELQAKLDAVLTNLLGFAEKTGDFVVEQAPLVVRDILRWGIAESIVFMLVGVAAFFALLMLSKFLKRQSKAYIEEAVRLETTQHNSYAGETQRSNSEVCTALSVVSVILGVIAATAFIIPNALQATKAAVAPRVYLLDWARGEIHKDSSGQR